MLDYNFDQYIQTIYFFYSCLWLEVDIRHPSVIQEHIDTRPDFELEYVKTYTDLTKRCMS